MAYLRLCSVSKGNTWPHGCDLTQWESLFWTKIPSYQTLKFYPQVGNIFRLKIYNSEKPLSNNFSSFLPENLIIFSTRHTSPSASSSFSSFQPIQTSVSYTLIPVSRVLSWTWLSSLLVTTIETWALTFCPLCSVILLWVNLNLHFFSHPFLSCQMVLQKRK